MKRFLLFIFLAYLNQLDAQIITTIAGNGFNAGNIPPTGGYSGDGGPAINAALNTPNSVVVDAHRNVFIADMNNNVIRRIDTNGIITTIAGTGTKGYSGDGGLATAAEMSSPTSIAFDSHWNLFIADNENAVIRKIDSNGVIHTVAGNGNFNYLGDGGPATSASLHYPTGIAFDKLNNMYFADSWNHVVRKVDLNGIITTIAGINGVWGSPPLGNGGPATAACLDHPEAVTVDSIGNIYIADMGQGLIRKVDTNGIISIFAGAQGGSFYYGDGGPAIAAGLRNPYGLTLDRSGNLYIADTYNHRVRIVDKNGIINTYAGKGTYSFSGDGGLAVNAELNTIPGVAMDSRGYLYIVDAENNRIRKVTPPLVVSVNSPSPVCSGITTTLTASGADTYSWSPATGLSSTTGSVVVANPTVTTTYTVVGTKGDSMGAATSIVTIKTISINPDSICPGGTATITASGAATCTWSTGETTLTINPSPTTTTTYTLSGSVATCTNSAVAATTVTIIPNPMVTITPAPVICADDTTILIANGASTYTWSTGAIGDTISLSPGITTSYTVTGADAICSNTTTAIATVTVTPNPTVTVSGLNYQTVCSGDTVAGIVFNVSPPGLVNWTNDNSSIGLASSGSGNILDFSAAAVSIQTIGVITANAISSGCASTSSTGFTYSITITPLPSASFTLTQSAAPSTWDAYASYSANIVGAHWFWGDGTDTIALYPSHTYATPGWYNICVTAYASCGDSAIDCQNDTLYRATNSNMVYVNVVNGNNTTDIKQNTDIDNFIIYPNPAATTINIQTAQIDKNMEIKVFDLIGNEKLQTTQKEIDISNLSDGLYFIQVKTSGSTYTNKIIIQR